MLPEGQPDDALRVRRADRGELAALARHTAESGHPRIDWTADRGNASAAGLYANLGATVEDKLSFRVREDGYEAFIARAAGRSSDD